MMIASSRSLIFVCLLAPLLATQLGSGCTNTAPSGDTDGSRDTLTIPRRATIVTSGVGKLSYVARSSGQVYLYDAKDRSVLDNRSIRRGQEYTVYPDQNRAELDGRKVYDGDLKKSHDHRIYFLDDDERDSSYNGPDRGGDADRIPRDAVRVADGKGQLSYQARYEGRAYLYDEDDDRLIWGRDLRRDQSLKVNPGADEITVDGKKVFDGNLARDHSHRIYFEKR